MYFSLLFLLKWQLINYSKTQLKSEYSVCYHNTTCHSSLVLLLLLLRSKVIAQSAGCKYVGMYPLVKQASI